ncbi:unnamed protein product [Brassica rapa]|uniref:Uncharacterized protein n=1 Tax=Brassica campestris TaxID=3711 RepID=A0A8D9CUL3_BRACM|nr:unnamed protein product [Brassica rapa]
MDSHRRPVCADGHTLTHTGHTRTHTDVLCADRQPRTSCVCWRTPTDTDTHRHTWTATDVLCVLRDSHRCPPRTSCVCWRTPTDVLCVLNRQPTWAKITQTSRGRVSVLSPRTNVLICVLMDSHGRPVHGRPVCADGHTQMFCECWWTPTDVLCVLNRQPTWAKITRTVHGKGQRAESKDQRADISTDGQPLTSCLHEHPVCADGHTQTATDVLCVLTDSHRQPQTSCTNTDSHGRPVCAGGHPQTSCVPRGPKSPEQSRGRVSVLSPRTNVLICVLMDSHRRPVCADGHTWTHTDSHERPVCADGHTQTQPTWAKITRTVHGKGQRTESKDQRADMSTYVLCVLTDTHGHTRTHMDVLCVLTDTHERPPRTSCECWRTPTDILRLVCADGQPQTATDILCVLADTHGRPVCTEQTAHVAKITQTVHGKGQHAESKDQRADMCTDGQPRTSCVC